MTTTRTRMLVTAAGLAAWIGAGAHAQIEGSAHDFSATSWAGGEICKPCHTPHFANTDIGFLWAHEMSTQTYTLFDGSTSSPGGVDELDQYSRMCLSCHDGTVALNAFRNGGGTPIYIDEGARVGAGGDLSDDHPIGIDAEYPINGSSGFHAPTLTPSGFYGFGGTGFPTIPLYPFQGQQVVSCSTCHNPHGKVGIDHLLRKSNTGSDLCLTCHIK